MYNFKDMWLVYEIISLKKKKYVNFLDNYDTLSGSLDV